MTGSTTAREPEAAGERDLAGQWMRAITAGLKAAGLTARLHHTRAGFDITAVLPRPDGRETEAVVDDDGYVELRYWNPAGATPAEVTEVIVRALAVVHGPPGAAR